MISSGSVIDSQNFCRHPASREESFWSHESLVSFIALNACCRICFVNLHDMVARGTSSSRAHELLKPDQRQEAIDECLRELSRTSQTKSSKYCLACSVLVFLPQIVQQEGAGCYSLLRVLANVAISILSECTRSEQVEQSFKLRYGLTRSLVSAGLLEDAHQAATTLCRSLPSLLGRKQGISASLRPAAIGSLLSLAICSAKSGLHWDTTINLLADIRPVMLLRSLTAADSPKTHAATLLGMLVKGGRPLLDCGLWDTFQCWLSCLVDLSCEFPELLPQALQGVGDSLARRGPSSPALPVTFSVLGIAPALEAALASGHDRAAVEFCHSLALCGDNQLQTCLCHLLQATSMQHPMISHAAWLIPLAPGPALPFLRDEVHSLLLNTCSDMLIANGLLADKGASNDRALAWNVLNTVRRTVAGCHNLEDLAPHLDVPCWRQLVQLLLLVPRISASISGKDIGHAAVAATGQAIRALPLALDSKDSKGSRIRPGESDDGAITELLVSEVEEAVETVLSFSRGQQEVSASQVRPGPSVHIKREEINWLSSILSNSAAKVQHSSSSAAVTRRVSRCSLLAAIAAVEHVPSGDQPAVLPGTDDVLSATVTKRALECISSVHPPALGLELSGICHADTFLVDVVAHWARCVLELCGDDDKTLHDDPTAITCSLEAAVVSQAIRSLSSNQCSGFIRSVVQAMQLLEKGTASAGGACQLTFTRSAARFCLLVLASPPISQTTMSEDEGNSSCKKEALTILLDEMMDQETAAGYARWLLAASQVCIASHTNCDLLGSYLGGPRFHNLIRRRLNMRKPEEALLMEELETVSCLWRAQQLLTTGLASRQLPEMASAAHAQSADSSMQSKQHPAPDVFLSVDQPHMETWLELRGSAQTAAASLAAVLESRKLKSNPEVVRDAHRLHADVLTLLPSGSHLSSINASTLQEQSLTVTTLDQLLKRADWQARRGETIAATVLLAQAQAAAMDFLARNPVDKQERERRLAHRLIAMERLLVILWKLALCLESLAMPDEAHVSFREALHLAKALGLIGASAMLLAQCTQCTARHTTTREARQTSRSTLLKESLTHMHTILQEAQSSPYYTAAPWMWELESLALQGAQLLLDAGAGHDMRSSGSATTIGCSRPKLDELRCRMARNLASEPVSRNGGINMLLQDVTRLMLDRLALGQGLIDSQQEGDNIAPSILTSVSEEGPSAFAFSRGLQALCMLTRVAAGVPKRDQPQARLWGLVNGAFMSEANSSSDSAELHHTKINTEEKIADGFEAEEVKPRTRGGLRKTRASSSLASRTTKPRSRAVHSKTTSSSSTVKQERGKPSAGQPGSISRENQHNVLWRAIMLSSQQPAIHSQVLKTAARLVASDGCPHLAALCLLCAQGWELGIQRTLVHLTQQRKCSETSGLDIGPEHFGDPADDSGKVLLGLDTSLLAKLAGLDEHSYSKYISSQSDDEEAVLWKELWRYPSFATTTGNNGPTSCLSEDRKKSVLALLQAAEQEATRILKETLECVAGSSDGVICGLHVGRPGTTLVVWRVERGREPLILEIPFASSSLKNQNLASTFNAALSLQDDDQISNDVIMPPFIVEEMARITAASTATMKEMPTATPSEARAWWQARLELDDALSILLRSVEHEILGPWRALLLGQSASEEVEGDFDVPLAWHALGFTGHDLDPEKCMLCSLLCTLRGAALTEKDANRAAYEMCQWVGGRGRPDALAELLCLPTKHRRLIHQPVEKEHTSKPATETGAPVRRAIRFADEEESKENEHDELERAMRGLNLKTASSEHSSGLNLGHEERSDAGFSTPSKQQSSSNELQSNIGVNAKTPGTAMKSRSRLRTMTSSSLKANQGSTTTAPGPAKAGATPRPRRVLKDVATPNPAFIKSRIVSDLSTGVAVPVPKTAPARARPSSSTIVDREGDDDVWKTPPRGPVILVLDAWLQCLPWESLPSLEKQSCYRMPSIALAVELRKFSKDSFETEALPVGRRPAAAGCTRKPYASHPPPVVDAGDAFYTLNPSGDLGETQTSLQPLFEAQPRWHGLVGAAPDPSTLSKALQSHQLFVYCGHGSGEQYLAPHRLRLLRCTAASLIMGCSSGRLRRSVCLPWMFGDPTISGAILAYLVAGCPAAPANLWDVTDKDIDRLTKEVLEQWLSCNSKKKLGGHDAIDISSTVNAARDACRLRFLNGAAVVTYGLPTSVGGRTSSTAR